MEEIEGNNSLEVSNQQAKDKNRLLIIIIIILSIALGITLWQFFDLRKTVSQKGSEIELLTDERGELENELQDMLNELDTLETNNDSMKVELANKRSEIEELLAKVKDRDFAVYKLKKETKTLRTIMKGYVVVIDSINTLNVGLRKENTEVRKTLSQERTKTKELQKTNDNLSSKVALASRLDVSGVSVYGVNVKRDLTGKETDRAKKVDKIRVCFTLDENRVAKAEQKDLFIRIIAPNGVILTQGTTDEYKFEFNGGKGFYTEKKRVDYSNDAKEYCMDWKKTEEEYIVQAGEYYVFLYAEDYEMASTTFNLK